MKHLSKEVEMELIRRIRTGDIEAKKIFIKENQNHVISIAKKYTFSKEVLSDLVAEGNKGLLKAIEKFNENFGTRFISYSYYWIRRYIVRDIERKKYAGLKIPERYRRLIDRVEHIRDDYLSREGRYLTDIEIAEELNLPPEIMNKLKKYASQVEILSLESYKSENDSYEAENRSEKPEDKFWDILQNDNILERIFSNLMKKEKRAKVDIWLKVIKLYYGLDGEKQYSYKEISEELDVSRQRVHQVKKICLQKMKQEWKEMKKNDIK
jgi:RNA polymerase primary sigma factor